MAQLIADRRDIDFALFEQLEADNLCKYEKFKEFNKKTLDMIITEARNFAIKEILPTFKEADREGLTFENGNVSVPKCFHKLYKLFCEGEWIATTGPAEFGGQGLPHVIAQAVTDYNLGANYAFTLYPWSGFGAGEMIEEFGTEEQKNLFIKKMYSGQWGGTMVLTEPQAGSDLGALTTSAKKNDDGTYTISGNKIFITNAEHDLTENIIHPVLARIEGAPKGSRGISLFIVPKIWVNPDGSLGEPNDVVCTGIEEKMGIHASATCSVNFGGKGKCKGFLLGEENKGMRVMFHMMNAARLLVGAIGFTCGSAAYLYALNYAKERLQGRDIEKIMDQEAPQVPIIKHPDVRRMLMWMKSHIEGIRSMIYYGALCLDKSKVSETEEQRTYYKELLDLLTPIIKAYSTDRGFEICSQAMQVYGGYGYTMEYPVEQLLRDCRIASIYEGTNGIQAMDLLARKMGMKKGEVFLNYISEIQKIINKAKEIDELKTIAFKLEKVINRLTETAMKLGKNAMSPDFKNAFAHAVPFLEVMGDVTMGWMLLWRATVAQPKLKKILGDLNEEAKMKKLAKNKNAAFYDGQIKSAQYFIKTILPITLGKMDSIDVCDGAIVEIPEVSFGG